MNLLFVILKKANLVYELCKELAEKGVHGGTILDGVGMASIIEKMDDLPMFSMLKSILADDDEHETVKTMLFVMDDAEMENYVPFAKEENLIYQDENIYVYAFDDASEVIDTLY